MRTLFRTYYWYPLNVETEEPQDEEAKIKFRRTLRADVEYGRLPTMIVPFQDCNLIGSLVTAHDHASLINKRLHLPCFDIDDPYGNTERINVMFGSAGTWIPSRSQGHWHYYLDVAMTWEMSEALLYFLARETIVDKAWAYACIDQGQMFLRKPTRFGYIP